MTKKKQKTDIHQNGVTNTRSWSELPAELLVDIAVRLGTRGEIRHFHAVCKHWQHSTPLAALPTKPLLNPLLPLNTSPIYHNDRGLTSKLGGKSPVLVVTSVCLIRPAADPTKHPWLVALEEFNRGKLYIRHPLSRVAIRSHNLPQDFPLLMNLSEYEISELYKGYCFRFRDDEWGMFTSSYRIRNKISKVVLFSNPASPSNSSIQNCTVFVIHQKGRLMALNLKTDEKEPISCVQMSAPGNAMIRFDDAVVFEDKVFVVDRRGRVYTISYGSSKMKKIVTEPISEGATGERKKSLVEFLGLLYLVNISNDRSRMKFRVYKLDVRGQQWVKVKSLGENNILFVSGGGGGGCFFASAKDLPGWRGDCIVFSKGSFIAYYSRSSKRDCRFIKWQTNDLDIAVYYLKDRVNGNEDGYAKPRQILYCSSYSKLFWPPPAWLSSDTCSSGGCSEENKQDTACSMEDEQDTEDVQQDKADSEEDEENTTNGEDKGKTTDAQLSTSSLELETQKQSSMSPSSSPSFGNLAEQSNLNQDHAHEEAETPLEKVSRLSAHLEVQEQSSGIPASAPSYGLPGNKSVTFSNHDHVLAHREEAQIPDELHSDSISRASMNFLTQCTKNPAFKKNFNDSEIRPDKLPILQKIWEKHGDIIEGTTVRNVGTIGRALDSLAEVVQILQCSPGRSLSDSQVEFLSSALFDLQLMGFKVDWLVPSIEKALTYHKYRSSIDALMEVEKGKAQAQARKVQLLDELAKVDQLEKELEDKRIIIAGELSLSGLTDLTDLDQCFGDGLC